MRDDRDPQEEKGFKVTDRRAVVGEPREEPPAPPEAPPPPRATGAPPRAAGASARPAAPLPAIDFATFVLSLTTNAFYHLGEMPRPDTDTTERNLPLAKQSIDIIAMLQDKTRGNLTEDEAQLLENLLYDLRIKYVQATK
ncbi:MAG TPA: DUF1844 domain-containing protein [Polyangia bacterium]|jgi:hypothetical protein